MFQDNFWVSTMRRARCLVAWILLTFYLAQADNGFEELRRLMKQGSDFLKEVATILNERSVQEASLIFVSGVWGKTKGVCSFINCRSEMEKQYSTKLAALTKRAKRAGALCVG